METKVVNVKKKHTGVNLKEWCSKEDQVYIGRRGIVFIDGKRYPKENSIFCNPFKINKDNSREDVLNKYKMHLMNQLKDSDFEEEFMRLKGKTLGCWCKPEGCHGDIIIEMLSKY